MPRLYVIKGPHLQDGETRKRKIKEAIAQDKLYLSLIDVLTRYDAVYDHFHEGVTKEDSAYYQGLITKKKSCQVWNSLQQEFRNRPEELTLQILVYASKWRQEGFPVRLCPTERADYRDNVALTEQVLRNAGRAFGMPGFSLTQEAKNKIAKAPAWFPYLFPLGDMLIDMRDEAIIKNILRHGKRNSVLLIGAYHLLQQLDEWKHPFDLYTVTFLKKQARTYLEGELPNTLEVEVTSAMKALGVKTDVYYKDLE